MASLTGGEPVSRGARQAPRRGVHRGGERTVKLVALVCSAMVAAVPDATSALERRLVATASRLVRCMGSNHGRYFHEDGHLAPVSVATARHGDGNPLPRGSSHSLSRTQRELYRVGLNRQWPRPNRVPARCPANRAGERSPHSCGPPHA
uniref:Uncharacterized protein n=1 Tax=Arundo donax TaxID=35708 RepID=A0A0A9GXK6_ARUDO